MVNALTASHPSTPGHPTPVYGGSRRSSALPPFPEAAAAPRRVVPAGPAALNAYLAQSCLQARLIQAAQTV